MKNFISANILTIMILGIGVMSCKNSENTPKQRDEVVLIKSFKTPIIIGAGGRGMKIILNIERDQKVVLDSIVYNNRNAAIDEVKKTANNFWIESYFYNEKTMIEGKGLVEYTAEGDSCQLYYNINGKAKSILIIDLELKQDERLWE